MDSDDDLLVSCVDDLEDGSQEEDWTDTNWAQPQHEGHTGYIEAPVQMNRNMQEGLCAAVEVQTMLTNNKSGLEEKTGVVERMLLNDNKAGMEGLDKARINQIIHEASKGSKFYENEKNKEVQMKKRIEEQRQKILLINKAQLREGLVEADKLLEDFEGQRDLGHTVVHIDMDAFYAAVEMRDKPSLKDKPMAVGGNNMLSTSNYHARKFGVRAAMPGFIGRKLCPDLVIVPTNFYKYTAVSKEVKSIMADYDPNFCPMSLDEAYLNITEYLERRREMAEIERTYICRDRAYTDSCHHCLCDLNEVARNHGSTLISLDDRNSSNFYNYFKNNQDKDTSIQTMPTTKMTDNSTNNKHEYSTNNNNYKTHIEEIEKNEADVAKSVEAGMCTKGKPLCPVCGCVFPPFTNVTFGVTDEDTVNELRTRIEQRTRLTASAGIAPNMMLAKVCSDKNKPNGQYKIPATRPAVMDFIHNLSIRKISGIGKVSEAMLTALGVHTCTDLYDQRALLYHLYSSISFNYFMRICLGIGSTTVERDSERKSISTERTFSELSKPGDLYQKCEELCDSLSEDLKGEQLKGKTVSIKIKTVKFEVKTRAHTLRDYTDDREVILQAALELLKVEIQQCQPHPLRLRLMGVRMSSLLNASLCKGKGKQNTILGAFKKAAQQSSKSMQPDPLALQSNKTTNSIHQSPALPTTPTQHPELPSEKLGMSKDNENQGSNISQVTETIVKQDAQHVSLIVAECVKRSENKLSSICDINDIDNTVVSQDCDMETDVEGLKVEDVECDEDTSINGELSDTQVYSGNTCTVSGELSGTLVGDCGNSTVEKDDSSEALAVTDSKTGGDNVHMSDTGAHLKDKESAVNLNKSNLKEDSSKLTHSENVNRNETYCITTCAETVTVNARKTRSGMVRTPGRPAKKRRNSRKQGTNESTMYACPICGRNVMCANLREFNDHVDECLEIGSSLPERTKISTLENTKSTTSDNDKSTEDATNVNGIGKYATIACEDATLVDTCISDRLCHDNEASVQNRTQNCIESNISTKHSILTNTNGLPDKCSVSQKEETKGINTITNKVHNNSSDKFNENVVSASTNKNSTKTDSKPSKIASHNDKNISIGSSQSAQDTTHIDETAKSKPDSSLKEIDKASNEHTSTDLQTQYTVGASSHAINGVTDKESSVSGSHVAKNATDNRNKMFDVANKENIISSSATSRDVVCDAADTKADNPDNTFANCLNRTKEDGIAKATNVFTTTDSDVATCINQAKAASTAKTTDASASTSTTDTADVYSEYPSDTEIDTSPDHLKCADTGTHSAGAYDVDLEASTFTDTSPRAAVTGLDSVFKLKSATSTTTNTADDVTLTPDCCSVQSVDDAVTAGSDAVLESDSEGDSDTDCDGALLVCPICNIEQRSASLVEFNNHVDSCLSKGTITEILREQRSQDRPSVKRSSSIPTTPGSSRSFKRRKTVLPEQKTACKSIASFFKIS